MKDDKLIIFLDMDGVCVDLKAAADNALGVNIPVKNGHFTKDIWRRIERRGSDFWRYAPETTEYQSLYKQLSKLGHVIYLTRPNLDPNCLKGKVQWLQDRHGKEFREYCITSYKYLLAKKGTILIDDMDLNIEGFIAASGDGVVFPQHWNDGGKVKDKVAYVIEEIGKILQKEMKDE